MQTINLRYYKSKAGGWRSWLIGLFTGTYSHVEIEIPRVPLNFSVAITPESGCVLQYGAKYDDDWVTQQIVIKDYQAEQLFQFYANYTYSGYDWLGAVSSFFGWGLNEKEDLFCSEGCLLGLKYIDKYDGLTNISPSRMYDIFQTNLCEKCGYIKLGQCMCEQIDAEESISNES